MGTGVGVGVGDGVGSGVGVGVGVGSGVGVGAASVVSTVVVSVVSEAVVVSDCLVLFAHEHKEAARAQTKIKDTNPVNLFISSPPTINKYIYTKK